MLPTLAAAPAPRRARRWPRRADLGDLPLAGHLYHHAEALWPTLRPGQRLALRREPWNRHDPCAVAIHADAHKLGYVPRYESPAIARLLDAGTPLRATIARLDPADGPRVWVRLVVGRGEGDGAHARTARRALVAGQTPLGRWTSAPTTRCFTRWRWLWQAIRSLRGRALRGASGATRYPPLRA
jgi:hypothetical protein